MAVKFVKEIKNEGLFSKKKKDDDDVKIPYLVVKQTSGAYAKEICKKVQDTYGGKVLRAGRNECSWLADDPKSFNSGHQFMKRLVDKDGGRAAIVTESLDEFLDLAPSVQVNPTVTANVDANVDAKGAKVPFLGGSIGEEIEDDEDLENIEESVEIDDSIKDQHDTLVAAGFSRDKVSPFGVSVEPTDICYSTEIDDMLVQVIYDEEWFDGKPGYILQFTGEEEDSVMSNTSPLSLKSCIKITNLAKKYFDEYPCTAKFMQKFADEYGLQFGF